MTLRENLALLPRFARWVLIGLVALTGVTIAALVYAAQFKPGRASAWFTALTVILALAALIAATLAAVWALPGYLEWAKEQRAVAVVDVWFEVQTAGSWERVNDGETIPVPRTGWWLVSVIISSTGDRVLHGATLNIGVPDWCAIDPRDPAEKRHYLMPRTSPSGLIEPGTTRDVRYTVVEREVISKQDLLYLVEVRAASGQSLHPVPVLASLSAEGLPAPIDVRVELQPSPDLD